MPLQTVTPPAAAVSPAPTKKTTGDQPPDFGAASTGSSPASVGCSAAGSATGSVGTGGASNEISLLAPALAVTDLACVRPSPKPATRSCCPGLKKIARCVTGAPCTSFLPSTSWHGSLHCTSSS